MSDSGEKTPRRKSLSQRLREEAVLRHLMLQPTVAAAAAATGVSEPTIRRWLRHPGFARRVNEARREAMVATTNALVGRSARALAAIDGCLSSANEAIRLRAASQWLDHARAMLGLVVQQEEIDRLHEQVQGLVARSAQCEKE